MKTLLNFTLLFEVNKVYTDLFQNYFKTLECEQSETQLVVLSEENFMIKQQIIYAIHNLGFVLNLFRTL